uniref:ATP synthase F0 subunit 8 n=1 Tax=Holothuria edulis TaxID=206668 RepID=A0A7G7MWL1_HOLED|nr:ATP synthase F0 subunit 8 [Holothuria edulis]QNG57220.1 ATP synthase F0 subunit 8 [Holothuria edulis]
MPQLDLAWFLFNFTIAWSLIFLVLLLLFNQNWKSEINQNENNISNPSHTNQWRW